MAKKNKSAEQDDLLAVELSFIDKHKNLLIIICVAIVAIVGIVSGWTYYSNKANLEAQEELFPCEAYFRAGQYDLALNGDSLGNKGLVELSQGSTKAANLATLYAGLSLAKQAKWEEAVKYLEDYDVEDDQTVSVEALHALGNCYANLKQTDKAVATLKKAAKQADGNSIAPVCLLEAAQILESAGNKAEARSLYESIKKDFPQMGGMVEKYILRTAE